MFEQTFSQNILKWTPPESKVKEREYVALYLRADMIRHIYKREEYDILTFFGDIGGFTDCIIVFGWLLTSALVSRLFQAALIQFTYRWQRYNIDDTPYYDTLIAGQVSENTISEVSHTPAQEQRFSNDLDRVSDGKLYQK